MEKSNAKNIRNKLIEELIPSLSDIEKSLKQNISEEEIYENTVNRIIDKNTWIGAIHTISEKLKENGFPVNPTMISHYLSQYWEKYENHDKAINKAFNKMLKIAEKSTYVRKSTPIYTYRTPEQKKKIQYERKERRKMLGL